MSWFLAYPTKALSFPGSWINNASVSLDIIPFFCKEFTARDTVSLAVFNLRAKSASEGLG